MKSPVTTKHFRYYITLNGSIGWKYQLHSKTSSETIDSQTIIYANWFHQRENFHNHSRSSDQHIVITTTNTETHKHTKHKDKSTQPNSFKFLFLRIHGMYVVAANSHHGSIKSRIFFRGINETMMYSWKSAINHRVLSVIKLNKYQSKQRQTYSRRDRKTNNELSRSLTKKGRKRKR